MAFTILTQSKIAKEWQNFINDADKYLDDIEKIANKPIITDKDKIKVKVMLEILLEEYKSLKSSNLIPKSLKQEADEKYQKVKKLYEELFK